MKKRTAQIFVWLSALCFGTAAVHAVTITDTQLQSNFNGAIGTGQSAAIAAAAFNFSLQPQLGSIQSLSITLTMIDGDTGLGLNGANDTPYPPDGNQYGDDDFDVNSLNLRLDGIDLGPGLLLNGFNSYDNNNPLAQSDFITLTISGTPTNIAPLLSALQDGTLVATVFDTTGISQSNGFRIPNTNFAGNQQVFATLSITGTAVPEPSAVALTIMGGAILVAGIRLRPAFQGARAQRSSPQSLSVLSSTKGAPSAARH